MAEPQGNHATDAVRDLNSLDLAPAEGYRLECYFTVGHLTSIVATEMVGRNPTQSLRQRFGKGRVLKAANGIHETEWVLGGRRLRISELDGTFDVILSVASP